LHQAQVFPLLQAADGSYSKVPRLAGICVPGQFSDGAGGGADKGLGCNQVFLCEEYGNGDVQLAANRIWSGDSDGLLHYG
jgi:hypothetical protein